METLSSHFALSIAFQSYLKAVIENTNSFISRSAYNKINLT